MNPIDRLDPEVAAWVAAAPHGDLSDEVMGIVREMVTPLAPSIDGVDRVEHLVAGDPEIPLRVHRPVQLEGPVPCVYAIHGGGYVAGSYNGDAGWLDGMSLALGVVAVSVDYRLAPETAYPGPLEDCYRGLQWVFEHAELLGVDPARVGVFGASAGGGLAAALTLAARDRGELSIAFQVLLSPMLDDRQVTASSRWDGLPIWSRRSNAFGWRSYLGSYSGGEDVPYTAAPARAENLSGLPPTFVSVGAVDGFVDEDVDYAMRLNRAGVRTELHVYPGACHGFEAIDGAAVAEQARTDVGRWLARETRS